MSSITEYQEWMASAHTDAAIVETIDIEHSAFTDIWLARWAVDFECTDELARTRTFQAADFRLEPGAVQDNMDQGTQGIIRALDGALYEALLAMTAAERLVPMTITHRIYFHDDASQPLIVPPPVWQVFAIQVDQTALTAELHAVQLRSRTVGQYYTLKNFPVLFYS